MTYIRVKDTYCIGFIILCLFYYLLRIKGLFITGTKGKTGSSLLVESILEHAGKKVGIIGTNGTFIGISMNLQPIPQNLQITAYHEKDGRT